MVCSEFQIYVALPVSVSFLGEVQCSRLIRVALQILESIRETSDGGADNASPLPQGRRVAHSRQAARADKGER